MAWRNDLLLAVQFLTRLPVRGDVDFSAAAQGRSLCFHPLVGLSIGGGLWLLAALLPPGPTTPALLLALWVIVTGGLHLDGLADSADAWSGGHGDPARTLAIMKDPASGPIGVAALVVVLLLKWAGITALLAADSPWLLLWPPLLARTAVPLMLLVTPYVRADGIGAEMAARIPRRVLWGVVAAVVLAVSWLSPWCLLWLGLMFWGLRRLSMARLGGVTGDTLGATIEIVEAAALVGLSWFVLPGG